MSGHFIQLVLLIHVIKAQFPEHTDLRKVGETVFNNEKYNILQPSVHKITDYFEDFMLRRGNKNKNERIFIDDSGFRHFWSEYGTKDESLRKTDISLYEINKNVKQGPKAIVFSENNYKQTTDNINKNSIDRNTRKPVTKKPKRRKTSRVEEQDKKTLLRIPAKPTATVKPTAKPPATVKPAAVASKPAAATVKPAAVASKPAVATVKPAAVASKPAAAIVKPAAVGGKKIAKVTYFCPFIGVITMTSFID